MKSILEYPFQEPSVHLINFRWLTALRWAAVVSQSLTVAVVTLVFGVEVPVWSLVGVIGIELALNIAAVRHGRRRTELGERQLASWVAADLIAFTALLYLSGGPLNPFSVFYVVHVAMAALTLSPAYAWSLLALSAVGYASLFAWHADLPANSSLLLKGSWVAYLLAASCVVYFVHRAREALRQRETLLAEQRDLRLQAERLSSLGTLAAGAAHELANPLATIAVVSKELEHDLKSSGLASAQQDVALVRNQVERCRKILSRMAHRAGEAPGEAERWMELSHLLGETVKELSDPSRVRVQVSEDEGVLQLLAPQEALAQSLRVLIDNALDATDGEVVVSVAVDSQGLSLRVADRGTGISPGVLQRVFEPFFTTKPTGKGMGLGLFLARNVALRLDGSLSLSSSPGQGTVANLRLPPARFRLTEPSH